MKALYAALFAATFAFAGIAQAAQTLTPKAAASFVSTLTDVNTLATEMEKQGKDNFFETEAEPKAGEKFSPYSKSLPALKAQYPAEYKRLGAIVKKHGFASQESWAATGDDVMLAYVASKMNIPAKSAMPQMPPEMMAKMPPEAVAKMKNGFAVLETMRSVPQAHKDIVAPLTPKIDMWIAANSAENMDKLDQVKPVK